LIRKLIVFGILLGLTLSVSTSSAQEEHPKAKPPPLTRILFIFDASQSMYGKWQSDIKINIAKKLMLNLLDSLSNAPNLELALRVYGHQKPFPPQDCNDTRLEVPFSKDNYKEIKNVLKTLIPKGTTPIAFAMEQAGGDFPPCENCRNIIVLITDGIEECDGDPCAVSLALQKKGIVLKPFIIGIGRNFSDAFHCVGTYYDASSEKAFSQALTTVISQALNSTTVQVNLLDSYGHPSETNVNMTFYDNFSGLPKYNFIHTLNNKGLPDTLVIDPLATYDLVINTLPPVHKDSIRLLPGKHTIIPVNTPQGYISMKAANNDKTARNLECIVRLHGEDQTLNVQNFGETRRYLTGKYDLEVLSLPRLYVNDVDVRQSHTTTIEIPQPGIVVIRKSFAGYGSLYAEQDSKLVWVYELRENLPQETLILQPGNYRVVYRSKNMRRSLYTVENRFTIQPGMTTDVKIFND
jgi:Ca-activated chloride channel homolog